MPSNTTDFFVNAAQMLAARPTYDDLTPQVEAAIDFVTGLESFIDIAAYRDACQARTDAVITAREAREAAYQEAIDRQAPQEKLAVLSRENKFGLHASEALEYMHEGTGFRLPEAMREKIKNGKLFGAHKIHRSFKNPEEIDSVDIALFELEARQDSHRDDYKEKQSLYLRVARGMDGNPSTRLHVDGRPVIVDGEAVDFKSREFNLTKHEDCDTLAKPLVKLALDLFGGTGEAISTQRLLETHRADSWHSERRGCDVDRIGAFGVIDRLERSLATLLPVGPQMPKWRARQINQQPKPAL